MFIETESGRLQNLYLLQDVRVVEIEDTKLYSIGYVQMNGVIVKEGKYETFEEADTKRQEIVNRLLTMNVEN